MRASSHLEDLIERFSGAEDAESTREMVRQMNRTGKALPPDLALRKLRELRRQRDQIDEVVKRLAAYASGWTKVGKHWHCLHRIRTKDEAEGVDDMSLHHYCGLVLLPSNFEFSENPSTDRCPKCEWIVAVSDFGETKPTVMVNNKLYAVYDCHLSEENFDLTARREVPGEGSVEIENVTLAWDDDNRRPAIKKVHHHQGHDSDGKWQYTTVTEYIEATLQLGSLLYVKG